MQQNEASNQMSALPSFSLDDITDVADDGSELAQSLRRRTDTSARRSRLHLVRWSHAPGPLVMKEVHLWEEDTATADVRTVAQRIACVQLSAQDTPCADVFASYVALHIDTLHHYQWLLRPYGPSLRAVLDRTSPAAVTPDGIGSLSEGDCARILRRILTALDHLHRVCGYVHGDVSLSNILTTPRSSTPTTTITTTTPAAAAAGGGGGEEKGYPSETENTWVVVLGDLETLVPVGEDASGAPGALLYTSPERLRDGALPAAPAADMWAVGVVAFQLLTAASTGHPWFRGAGARTTAAAFDSYWALLDAMRAVEDTPPLEYLKATAASACSPDALRVVASCLSWEPCDRPSAQVLLSDCWFSC